MTFQADKAGCQAANSQAWRGIQRGEGLGVPTSTVARRS